MDNFIFFLNEGLFHVLDWNAYDHILFFLALAVIYEFGQWKKVLWLITLFTIGHTVTLFLAAYNLVKFSSEWIEFLIPVTIMVTALVNIFYAKRATNQTRSNTNLIFAAAFGLIHGFGFSTYFRMLIGESDNKMISLLEFALGIEIAQIIVVILVLVLGFIMQNIFRFSKRDWVMIASSVVIGVVLPILMENKIW